MQLNRSVLVRGTTLRRRAPDAFACVAATATRQLALAHALQRCFQSGGWVVEFDGTRSGLARRPGVRSDRDHTATSLGMLLARRACEFGYDLELHFSRIPWSRRLFGSPVTPQSSGEPTSGVEREADGPSHMCGH